MLNDLLLLRAKSDDLYFKYTSKLKKDNYYIFDPIKNIVIYKIISKLRLNRFFLGKWRKQIKKYKYIILSENYYSTSISNYIKKKNPNCIIIMFFLNTIDNYYKKIFNDKNIDEFWTFDKNDSIKYGIKYKGQMFTNEYKMSNEKVEYDVFYLGRNKGRKHEIDKIKEILDKNKITNYFKIIDNEKDYIQYDTYLKILSKTKCIVDINKNNQIGLSLRPLEALFFNKKLITNNKDIVNYDFYNKNNIFVLGLDNIDDLKKFILSDYYIINDNVKMQYNYTEILSEVGGTVEH